MKVRTLLLAFTAVASACATIPEPNRALDSARSAYHLAIADPETNLRAPVELQMAERQLAEAERAWGAGNDPATVAHLAYLAEQRARIAMKTADFRKAEAAVATSSDQRNRVVLEARTREADAGKRAAGDRAALLGDELRRLQAEVSDLKAGETERGWVLTLNNDLLFDSGQASLKPGGRKAVENLAQLLRKQPDRDIAVEGFTDSTGSDELNRRLSQDRAQAVKEVLVARGIEPGRIAARGFGPAFPVASNETPTGRQLNRRVQVVIAPEPRPSSSGGATGGGATGR